jgi:hypothetical protein
LWSLTRADINANFQTIDDKFGTVICTSATRPSSPYAGQAIYETDTRFIYVRNSTNTVWQMYGNVPSVATTASLPTGYNGQLVFVTTGNVMYRFNGSSWVIHNLFFYSSNNTVSAAENSVSTSYAALTTAGPAVTLTSVGTQALVCMRCIAFGTDATFRGVAASFAISGATTLASSDSNGAVATANNAGYGFTLMSTQLVTITPGTNTYTMQYKTSALTSTFQSRRLFVFAP